MGLKSEGYDLYSRLSSRLKLTLFNKPGNGWTLSVDVRDRYTLAGRGENQLIIYDAKISYNGPKIKLFLSLGQMNLYDTAGIGELTGAIIGYKLNKFLSAGGYAGLEPDIYKNKWDTKYNKYGLFIRYIGSGAKQFSLSFNRLIYDGELERQYLYSSILLPLKRTLVLFGNLQYELNNLTKDEDRLTQLFLNARLNISRFIDITANYSSGRGLDYHYFLLEQSQNPTLQNNEIDRFYYNQTYGVRLSIKPSKRLRVFAARRESEMKDRNIKNHTTRFGLSAANFLNTGMYLYGSYNLNRGDYSESDSYYISTSRNFGKFSLSLSFANYFNGVRMTGKGAPEVFHYPDRKTLSANIFFIVNRHLALSLDYALSFQDQNNEHQVFIRVILRK
jgi:hypothetical protein